MENIGFLLGLRSFAVVGANFKGNGSVFWVYQNVNSVLAWAGSWQESFFKNSKIEHTVSEPPTKIMKISIRYQSE